VKALLFAVLLGLLPASRAAPATLLPRCQLALAAIRPLAFYIAPSGAGRGRVVHVLLGIRFPFGEFGIDGLGRAVPLGLAALAVPGRPDRAFDSVAAERVLSELSLSAVVVRRPFGYLCLLTDRGRVVGWLRANRQLEPSPVPGWRLILARARWSFELAPHRTRRPARHRGG
jgi:hypothetical protein